jgi:hypothetical protein
MGGGRGKALVLNVAGASDAHKRVKIDLIRDRLDLVT